MAVFDKEKIRFYLKSYQKNLPEYWNEENYKWKAVEFFQKNWNIESPDFWEMLKLATSKHVNLLGSGMYFPLGMLRDFIEVAQERVRNMFRVLYDEDQDLVERIRYYQNEAEQLRLTDTNRWKNHYQDLRAVSVLLWLRYPDKYYIYKSKEFRKTLELIESDFSHKGGATPEYYVRFLDMMNIIREEISGDVDLTKTLNELVQSTPDAYDDRNLHIATVDFVFYIGKRFENEQSLIDVKIQPRMEGQRKLQIGDMSDNGQITIVDEDRLCYIVKNENHGAVGLRTISKALLDEFVAYIKQHPDANGNEAKAALSGYSDIDKYEYGYNATYVMMAKMVLGYINVIGNSIAIKSHAKPFSGKLQQIYYGAPGTGKSHIINKKICSESVIRTTFHPDSDYSTFVGCYKPTTKTVKMRDLSGQVIEENGVELTEDRIVYEFVDQAFLQAYIQAWKFYDDKNEEIKNQFLVIEEINRGNCAQIFGDLFQLLDRNPYGFSDYPIHADNDMKKQLAKAFKGLNISDENKARINACYNDDKDYVKQVLEGEILLLPNNLYIWATMNTSDQSLFPIDSAFKRRWDWQYMPIAKGRDENGKELNWRIVADTNEYDWWSFLTKINEQIGSTTNSEDKKLGFFFCKAIDGEISAETFVGKVIFYLWNDVFKDFGFDNAIFNDEDGTTLSFDKFYATENGKVIVKKDKVQKFLDNLKVEIASIAIDDESIEDDEEDDTDNAKLTISFSDGVMITGDNSFDTYINAIKKIGVNNIKPVLSQFTYKRLDSPLISSEKYDAIENSNRYSYIEIDGCYIVKGIGKRTIKRNLVALSKLLDLNLQLN